MFSEPYPRHLTQRDNVNPHKPEVNTPASQCSIATFTMLMNWIGDKYNIPEFSKLTEFDLYLVMENVSQFKGINRIGSSLTALHAFNMLLEQDKYKAQMVNNYGHYVKAVLSEAPSPEKLFDIMVGPKTSAKKFNIYRIELRPRKNTSLHGKLEQIIVEIRDDLWLPDSATLTESDGDETVWEFTDYKINPKIKDSVFKLEVPKGYQLKKLETK